MKDELGEKVRTKFVGLRPKMYCYLIDDGSEDKKSKGTKKCPIKRKLKFENYKIYLEALQLENKINHLEKKKRIYMDSFKKDYKEFIKKNRLILKIQQRFRSERHNIFTEEINKIALSSNIDEIIQSIDLMHMHMRHAYGTSKHLVIEKEEIKCSNIIKQYKKP